jgi:predicted extracellular nuclease
MLGFAAAALSCFAPAASAASSSVVISQVYGAGGNSGAVYQNDYVELFNLSGAPVSVSAWSVQYTSATGTGNFSSFVTALSGTIPAGGYYLVKLAGGASGVALPAADATGTTNMAAGGGKVILANVATGLACNGSSTPCNAAQLAQIVDLVGQGGANFFEGSGAAPAPSTTLADFRASNGCTDTDNNSADFATAAPSPRNSASPVNPCGGGTSTPPSGTGAANPASADEGGITLLTVSTSVGTNPASPISSVTADLSSIGGAAAQTFYDDGSNGDEIASDGIYSYSATVSAGTASGVKTLPVTITDALARSGTTSISLSVSLPPMSIMQIQGHGAASPYAGPNGTLGALVTTPDAAHTNIVTAVAKNGFYIQDSAGDNNVTTSDAVFVFTSSAPGVHVGDAVTVSGKVQEFNGATEITGTPIVTIVNSGNALPAPYVFDANPPTEDPTTGICLGEGSTVDPPADGYQASNFACLDGMLVAMNDGIVTGATFGSGSDGVHTGTPSGFYATVGSEPRPFRFAGAIYPGLGIPSIPVWSGAPQIVEVFYAGLGFSSLNHVYDAGQHFAITGVIQNFKGTYEIYPVTLDSIGSAPAYPVPVADSVAGTLTIATQNMLHFFNNVADGADTSQYTDNCNGTGSSDTCPTAAQYAARLTKMSRQIREVLKAPIVLGVEEVENYSVLSDIANQVFSDGGPRYQPFTIPGNDPGGINLGVLVRNDVTVNSLTQLFKGTMTSSCSSNPPCLLNDRPPLLLDAVFNGYHFNLLVIYDRSLINLGVLDYVGTKRTEQAVQVASVVQALQSGATLFGAGDAQQDASGTVTLGAFDVIGSANVPLIVVGDFNAYEFSDGYVDVTGMISGTAIQAENLYWDQSGTYAAPAPPLFDTGAAANPADHYSYNFAGYAQEIDHVLLSSVAQNDFIAIANAHGNSDVSEAGPAVLDPNTASRTSDHDGQVVTLGYVVTPGAGAHGTISPAGVRTVSLGSQQVFTVTPDTGYSASIGGSCGGNLNGNTYITLPVTANCSVSVTFALNPVDGVCGGDNGQTLLAAPTNLCSVGTPSSVDGSGHPWTWTCAGANGGQSATCSAQLQTWTVTPGTGSNGSISPNAPQTVDNGATTSFTLTPATGFAIDSVSGCGGSLVGNVYTTGAITADCAVSATFANAIYKVTPVAGAHGTISPATPQFVGYNGVVTFKANPDPKYKTMGVSGCGATLKSNNTITTAPVTGDCTLTVTFGR